MNRLLVILAALLLATNAWSQRFIVPPATKKPKTSKNTSDGNKKAESSSTMPGVKPKPSISSAAQGQGIPHSATKQMADATAGHVVEGIERSLAIDELEAKAAKGDADAHATLGMYYFQKGDSRALEHLETGAKAGNGNALYYLGGVYYFGKFGVKADKRKAARYYLQAAKEGNALAQYAIAVCLYDGDGVVKDRQAARKWMETAAKNNCQDAKDFLQSHSFE